MNKKLDNLHLTHCSQAECAFNIRRFLFTDRPENVCYAKLIVNVKDDERIVGFHYMGPNAGEVTQGFAGMMKLKATKADMENVVGIHPTCAEIFTTMNVTKSSGKDVGASGC